MAACFIPTILKVVVLLSLNLCLMKTMRTGRMPISCMRNLRAAVTGAPSAESSQCPQAQNSRVPTRPATSLRPRVGTREAWLAVLWMVAAEGPEGPRSALNQRWPRVQKETNAILTTLFTLLPCQPTRYSENYDVAEKEKVGQPQCLLLVLSHSSARWR